MGIIAIRNKVHYNGRGQNYPFSNFPTPYKTTAQEIIRLGFLHKR